MKQKKNKTKNFLRPFGSKRQSRAGSFRNSMYICTVRMKVSHFPTFPLRTFKFLECHFEFFEGLMGVNLF
jgi:hypothetical protein